MTYLAGFQVQPDRNLLDYRGQHFPLEGLTAILTQRCLQSAGRNILYMLVDSLEAAILLEQSGGCLLSDTRQARYVIRDITNQCFEIRELLRFDAVLLLYRLLVVEDGIRKGPFRDEGFYSRQDYLQHVIVAGNDDGVNTAFICLLA